MQNLTISICRGDSILQETAPGSLKPFVGRGPDQSINYQLEIINYQLSVGAVLSVTAVNLNPRI